MGNSMVHSFIRANLPSKRKASVFETEYENSEEVYDLDKYEFEAGRCVQRRKAAKTTKYIFKTLFEEQQGSDIIIKALNRTWNLHKLYLSQSPYFNTMFNGDWLETQKKEIEIHVDDSNVTPEALNKVFSSFYQDDIQIEPDEAIPVIGAASLLQMDDICLQCIQVMKRNVNIDTVIPYYDSADFYCLKQLKDIAFDWLLKNLLYRVSKSPSHLQRISCDLMADLVESPNLLVIQTEFSVYFLLKKWLFLKENKCTLDAELDLDKLADDYFRNFSTSPYLLSSSGLKYQKAFLALRKNHLISHRIDLRVIDTDNIMPADWFLPVFKLQWYQMLQIEEGDDLGPTEVSEEIFNKYSTRVGRVIKYDRETNWRWTGFNYGLDLIVNYNRGTVLLSRGHEQEIEVRNILAILYKDKKRSIMYRIGIYSLDKNGRVIKKQETGLKSIALAFREQKSVMNFDSEMKFPVLFSANFLVTTPLGQGNLKNISTEIENIQSD